MKVTSLFYYPVKSCKGISIDKAQIGPRGILHDREWMIVDENQMFLTQREIPRLALIRATLEGEALRLSAPDMPTIIVAREDRETSFDVTVWSDRCRGLDQGDAASDWLSKFLQVTCRLVRFDERFIRQVDSHYALRASDQVGFADGYPFLLVSEESLADLNSRLEPSLPMNRFRPNIVVSGCLPFAEDTWKKIRIGKIDFDVVKPCIRCRITTTDQDTAKVGKEPLKTLATFRLFDKGIAFGQNLIHSGSGTILVGDQVEILS